MHHKLTPFLEAGDIQEGASCSEVTDTIVDKEIHNAVSQLNTLAKTPVNIDALKQELEFYDSNEAQIILNGFVNGFPLNYVGPCMPSESKNLNSALIRPEITKQKIDKEVAEGRVAGPFPLPPLPNLRISPLGLVEKKSGCDFRLIHHLSYPKNDSVNDFIDPKLCYVKYASFDEAIAIVQDLGPGCLLGKSDLKNAFRILPVAAKDFDQLGFCFNNKYYFDKALPFRCSISCATFEKFATFLEFAVHRRSPVGRLLHYLDDSLFWW